MIDDGKVDDEDPAKNVLTKARWFSTVDIYALLNLYACEIMEEGKSRESDGNYANFIEAQVHYDNIVEVIKTKAEDDPHILLVNHDEIHWQLLVHKDLLQEKQMVSEGLVADSRSPYYYNLKSKVMPSMLSSYILLKNDRDGNCGPHVLLQMIQVLHSHTKFSKFLTAEGTRVYNTYHDKSEAFSGRIFLIGDSILDNSYWNDVGKQGKSTGQVLTSMIDTQVVDYSAEEMTAKQLLECINTKEPYVVRKNYVEARGSQWISLPPNAALRRGPLATDGKGCGLLVGGWQRYDAFREYG